MVSVDVKHRVYLLNLLSLPVRYASWRRGTRHLGSMVGEDRFNLMRLDHFVSRPQKRGGLLGTGTGGGGRGGREGTQEWRLDRGYRPKKTGETVDRRQNNGNVKAVSPRHCPATSALRNCCFNCRAWAQSQGQCPLHCCWGTTRSERSPTFASQLHIPAHDLFWANLTEGPAPPPSSRSLDRLISPGTLLMRLNPLTYI